MTAAPVSLTADVLIVGAGPTGLYGAYYAGFRGLPTTIVDALPPVTMRHLDRVERHGSRESPGSIPRAQPRADSAE